MAEFFDRKEEVIDLKLTRYGRYLYSKGKLRPEYYAFYDDDIIYDASYGPSETEEQNDIVKRIKEDTPRQKGQNCISGVESDVRLILEPLQDDLVYGTDAQLISLQEEFTAISQKSKEKVHVLSQPLAQSEPSSQHIPAWKIQFHKAELTSVETSYTGSSDELSLSPIPQLQTRHQIKTFLETEILPGVGPDDFGLSEDDTIVAGGPLAMISEGRSELDPQLISEIYTVDEGIEEYGITEQDSVFITGKEDYVFLEVEETSTDFTAENFDIEVFEITTNADGDEVLTQKYFFQKDDELSYSANEIAIADNFPVLDDTYVEYWFDIDVDKHIPPSVFCETGLSEKKKDLYADLNIDMECPDNMLDTVYDTTVEEEPC